MPRAKLLLDVPWYALISDKALHDHINRLDSAIREIEQVRDKRYTSLLGREIK